MMESIKMLNSIHGHTEQKMVTQQCTMEKCLSGKEPNKPFHPNISRHILHTVLCTFPEVLTGRIGLTSRAYGFYDNFSYSHDLNIRGDIVEIN